MDRRAKYTIGGLRGLVTHWERKTKNYANQDNSYGNLIYFNSTINWEKRIFII